MDKQETSRSQPLSGSQAQPGNQRYCGLCPPQRRWLQGRGRQSLQDSAFPGRSLRTSVKWFSFVKEVPTTVGRLTVVAIILLICLLPSLAWGQYTTTDVAVTRSMRGRDVLRVQSVLDIPPGAKTNVLKVSIIAPKPSPADRDLIVVFYQETYAAVTDSNIAYRMPVRLEEGQSRIDLEIPHLSFSSQTFWDFGIFEEGRDIEDTRGKTRGANWTNADSQFKSLGALLSIGESETTELKNLEDLSKHINLHSNPPNTIGIPTAAVFPVSTASDDWRFYFSRPMWLVSPAAVAEINARPEMAEALRNYVAASGLLLVHGVEQAEQLAEVEKLFGTEPLATQKGLWTADFGTDHGLLVAKREKYLSSPVESLTEHPLLRQFCFGSVLVTSEPLPEMTSVYWKNTLGTLIEGNLVAPGTDGDWFWRNLIRAVGKPPVWIFCGIVALFGALLGPGLLVFTARMARRSLMIFLVPAISLVATVAIVTYGVLHEGFETHLRVTSVQAVDTTTGEGFVWSRQNYFSGLPPRDGISFSPKTFARSVAAEERSRNYGWDGNPRRGIDLTVTLLPDKQIWTGWLKPRQQQQLLIGHTATYSKLPIAIERSKTGEIQVENIGTTHLPVVLLRGEKLDYYFTEHLAPQQAVKIRVDDLETVRARVAKIMVDYRPTSPPELGEGGSLLDFGSNSRRYTAQTMYYDSGDVLNTIFQQRMSDKLELPPFGFAILTTESDKVEVPLTGSSADNLHLIVGTQPW